MSELLATYNKEDIRELISDISDPEIPVLTIADLGILRGIDLEKETFIIKITPTYSGCPAMKAIEQEIEKVLRVNGIQNFIVKKDFSETWTTDWMTGEARQKLKEYGIAPPTPVGKQKNVLLSQIKETNAKVACPYCSSTNTELQNNFGSTACKSQYYCHDCDEPFEHFKCI